tara:strand:- start:1046 stop:2740 length:1695 start_codon:yes stop_codon:yes gene_type:complete
MIERTPVTNSTPNVLFIMADQMKASILRMYSSEIGIETPTLERLADDGVRFEHAITPHPLCVPARTSVMTGRYPHSTGCRRNETLMPENEQHAFRIWKDNGFTTGLIGKNHCYIEPSDLELFDVRCEISHAGLPEEGKYKGENFGNTGMEWVVPEVDINAAHEVRANLRQNAQSPRIAYAVSDTPEEQFGTSVIATQTEAFLDKYVAGDFASNDSGDQNPFALWVSFPDPHEPFEAPRRYVDMFPPEDIVLPPQRTNEYTDGTSPERNRVLARMMRQTGDSEEHRRGVVSVYQAMTRFVDDGIGRIVDKLDDLGLRENTIIVFTADHGDFIGEHGMAVKGGVFYDALVQVPMIVSWPGGGVPQGVVEDSMTSTIDILPTLLELQGLASFDGIGAGWARGEDSEGETALSEQETRRMQGRPLPTVTAATPRSAAFSEYGSGGPPVTMGQLDALDEPFGYDTIIETLWGREAEGRRKMVRTKEWKYVTDPMARGATLTSGSDGGPGDIDELYDLTKDPWELTNVAHLSENATVISEMRSLLASWMIDTEDPSPVEVPKSIGRVVPR